MGDGSIVPYCFGVIKMPRQARKKSESGIYHIMLRGINQQQIFLGQCLACLSLINDKSDSEKSESFFIAN
jgi:hypothetical protein